MGQWSLPGPDELRLSRARVCDILGISEDTLTRAIDEGRFPQGIKPSPQAEPFWTGADLAAYLHLAGRLKKVEEKPPREKS